METTEAPTEEALLSAPGVQPYKGETLRIMGIGVVPQFAYQAELLHPKYEELSGVKVIWEDTPFGDLYPKIQMMCGAKSDEYDLFWLMEYWQGPAVEQWDCVEELSSFYKAAPGDAAPEDYLLSTFSQIAMWKDTWVGLPANHAVGIMAYRKDLFEDPNYQAEFKEKYGRELKVPETWEEYLEVGQFFTRDTDGDGKVDLWGLNHRYGGDPSTIFSDWLVGFANSRGLQYWDDTFHPKFNSPEAIESAEFFLSQELLAVQPPGAEAFEFTEVMQNMTQGKVAMYVTENWSIPLLLDPEVGPYYDKIAFAPIPGWKNPETGEIQRGTMSAGASYVINKNISPEKKKVAWDWLQFVHGKTTQMWFTEETGTGNRISGHTDPESLAKWPHLAANLEQMRVGMPRPKEPWWEEAVSAIGDQMTAALLREKTVEQAMNDANAAVEKIIEKAGYYETPRYYDDKQEMEAFACKKLKELGLVHPDCKE